MTKRIVCLLVILLTFATAGTVEASARPELTFDQRVEAQRAIEEVYWRHRLWPDQNEKPKPSLSEVLPDEAIRERVTDYLEKSAALERFWSRPLTGEQLQAEINRMQRNSKDARRLRALFEALGDDPFLIAECLARPALVDRLAHDWYVRDARFHGALELRARQAIAEHDAARSMQDLGGDYVVTELRLVTEMSPSTGPGVEDSGRQIREMANDEWRENVGRLAALFGVVESAEVGADTTTLLSRVPLERVSSLDEDDGGFTVTTVRLKQVDRLEVASVRWAKRPFDTWWKHDARPAIAAAAGADAAAAAPPSGGYLASPQEETGCSEDTWSETASTVSERSSHTAVWTGAEMILWGGSESGVRVNTGARYDPAIDAFFATSTVNAPSARENHSAVWTGLEMIVWGGSPTTDNSGGRYDPTTDSWLATSTENAPSERTDHTAVWTGGEMILWGGWNAGFLNTGARYDPSADSWLATSTENAPAERAFHTAVWPGGEMILWGGRNPGFLNTGARYDPSADSWLATSTENAPVERAFHTAVWTGSEMIVWGGLPLVNTGGRYDPTADSWLATSTENAPAERGYHTAVWTGSEMIVWGGVILLNTGGRYDPTADSWLATSMENVPSGRHDHTAVWTGSEMIVWGGVSSPLIPIGSRYCVCPDGGTWYPDLDGDGFGFTATGLSACEVPPLYITATGDCDDGAPDTYTGAPQLCDGVNNDCDDPTWPTIPQDEIDQDGDAQAPCGGDCDEADPATYSDAPEVNDGRDNQCDGDFGWGMIDEVTGSGLFIRDGTNDRFCWIAQAGAALYQVTRSGVETFATDCQTQTSEMECWTDPEDPPPGEVFYYVVRALLPHAGDWGKDRDGVERELPCQLGELDCGDGLDDDGDGLTDCYDPECDGAEICEYGFEVSCADGEDNDVDGAPDCHDTDCDGLSGCEYGAELTCDDEFDNDADAGTDCEDVDCDGVGVCEYGFEDSCADGEDNDADAMTDCEDVNCHGRNGCEYGTEWTCNDWFDNDADVATDCEDIDCDGRLWCEYGTELSCGDGRDNDADGLSDCYDVDCYDVSPCEHPAERTCADNFDNDADGPKDCADVDCYGVSPCEHPTELTCDDDFDNDGDGLRDCWDPDCYGVGEDAPDPQFLDTNCDGIDGDIDKAVFVSKFGGNDANPGTMAEPKQTIAGGMALASPAGRNQVLIASGTYPERLNMYAAIGLYGGYESAGWTRSAAIARPVVAPSASATLPAVVRAMTLGNGGWLLDRLRIVAPSAASLPGVPSIGVFAASSNGLAIRDCEIVSRSGASGGPGSDGADGADGLPGAHGEDACQLGDCDWPYEAPGGSSSAGCAGGQGGIAGQGPGAGQDGSRGGCTGGLPGDGGSYGNDGDNGIAGSWGGTLPDQAGGGSFGTLINNVQMYDPDDGSDGWDGTRGLGGGGGGGGGGGLQGGFLPWTGGSGGGGGGGGAGGSGGLAGGGGGASIAIALSGCDNVEIRDNLIETGAGGPGGAGGSGGQGGDPGAGGSRGDDSAYSGRGGNGGPGGGGGNGSGGGGGGGGPCVGIAAKSTTFVSAPAVDNTIQLGTPGAGGAGGGTGNSGATGLSQTVYEY